MNEAENFPMHVGIVVTSAAQLASVYALLGGVALAAVATAAPSPAKTPEPAPAAGGEAAPAVDAGPDVSGEIDAGGHPWSADLHASTKGKTKDGFWRMKVGVSRPDPKPGYPLAEATGTAESGKASEAGESATTETAPSTAGDDDEFAAFRAAAAESDAKDAAAKAGVAPRKWTDADLGALCNQAATKLGDPTPVKAVIAEFIPEGTVAHSRNIPEERREEFAKAVEAKAGIEFAG